MADPATMMAIGAGVQGLMGLAGIGQGGHEGAVEYEQGATVGRDARAQNARLLRGPSPFPGYSQSVQGYGPSDESGAYTPISPPMMGPPAAQAPQQQQPRQGVPQQQPRQGVPTIANPQIIQVSPQQSLGYQMMNSFAGPQGAQGVQGPVMQTLFGPQAAQPTMFGIPVFFDDGVNGVNDGRR